MIHTLEELRSGKLEGSKQLKIQEGLLEFPEELFSLCDSLELLDLSGNLLSDLPDLSRFKKLKIAFFSQNSFEKIPDVFKACSNLYMLGFKSNAITVFDEDILPLSISWLILTENRLTALPLSIGKLHKLQKFAVAGNRLKSLPNSMRECKNLELLRLSANELEEIPEWLFTLPKLAWFAFSGNPCSISKGSSLNVVAYKDIELDTLLGEGASGKIYRAHSPLFKSLVAVKLFKGAVTSDGYAKDEMNACMMAGEHPNLIKVLARVEHKHLGLILEYISKEYITLGNPPNFETCTRDTYEEDSSFSSEEILVIAKSIAGAAGHLHSKGIVHGDLYAHNILYNQKDNAYLGDFGAASFYDVGSEKHERLDVLAYGHLLEDLLTRCLDRESKLYKNLVVLQERCQVHDPKKRPLFCEMEF